MLTLTVVLALLALGLAVASATEPPKVPLWIAVVVLALLELAQILPR